ncbi:MAG: SDR family NAD(P)-dependent oxidoreductase [Clostridiales bacterium]|nr:SDR family NAD(P)-dependent oxidoreductase [Clostridiales bacterium]MBR0469540.1 SDR family NAD(P)-dependent oxidoreductase [Mogibacterium sp.]
MYDMLFSPMDIGTVTIKNRIVMTAAEFSLGEPSGKVTPRLSDYYEERAKGGVGLIIPGICRVNDMAGAATYTQLAMSHDYHIEPMREMVRKLHSHGAKLAIQLHHAGRQGLASSINSLPLVIPVAERVPKFMDLMYKCTPMLLGMEEKGICFSVQAPSDGPLAPHGAARMHAMSKKEIRALINDFIDAAERCKKAGVDIVELHGAHGYLIQQFLSPYTNHRTDEYGGSFENRMRFLEEIVTGIKRRCGKDYPLMVRLTVDEMMERIGKAGEGYGLETGKKIAKRLEELGVDAINVSSANYDTYNCWLEPTTYEPGWRKHLAKAIKETVDIPVIAANVIRTPEQAEKQLEEGCQDFVASARAFICDPHWPEKAQSGHPEDIQRCIGCLNCIRSFMTNAGEGKPGECALNMSVANERFYYDMPKDGQGRKVIVIGAGPAGLTAAKTMAMRGFDVELYEKAEKAGGQVIAASSGSRKSRLYWAIEDLMTAAKKEGAKIFLGKALSAVEIMDKRPFAVICATGGTPLRPRSIPGTDREDVIAAPDLLLGKASINKSDVVVIGSGMTGLETTQYLNEHGNKVTIVEMADEIAPGAWFQLVDDEMERIRPYGTKILTGTKLCSIEDGGVIVEDKVSGKQQKIKADRVVLAMGVRPQTALADDLKDLGVRNVFCVGDAEKSGTIAHACHSAYDTVMNIGRDRDAAEVSSKEAASMAGLSKITELVFKKKLSEIKGKNIVITGASSGIGKEVLDRLADPAKNNKVLATSRTIEKLKGYGSNVTLFNSDVSKREGVDKLFEKAESLFDKIDIVIANAGAPYYEKFDYVDWDRIQNIFDLNTISPIYTYAKYLEHLNGREGHIAFTISAMGEMAIPGYALYTATKFAMKGFQEEIRLEAPKNIKVTAVYPVSTATNFFNVGGNGIDVGRPFPVQKAEVVAERMISGIEQAKKHVYPCRVWKPSKLLMSVVPQVKSIYWGIEKNRLKRFVKKKAELEDK